MNITHCRRPDGEFVLKAISLWQPWASLMADGQKKIETRHWPAPAYLVGQPLAIHATKKIDKEFAYRVGYGANGILCPRGAVVAIVRLDKVERFTEEFELKMTKNPEGLFGDFSCGRFGWFCTLLEKLD